MDITMIDLLVALIEMLTLAYFYKKFLYAGSRALPPIVQIGGYGLAGAGIIWLGEVSRGEPLLLSLAAGAVAYVVAELIYKGDLQSKLFGALVFTVIQFGSEAIAWCFITLTAGIIEAYHVQLPIENYIHGALMSKGIAALVVIGFTRWKVQNGELAVKVKTPIYWLLPLITVILMHMLIDLTFAVDINAIKIRIALVCLALIVLNFLVTYLWHNQLKLEYLKREVLLMDITMEKRMQYCEAVENQNERINRIGHEAKRYAVTFRQLLENNEVDKAKTFLTSFLEDMDKQTMLYARDVVLNAILTIAHEQAEGICALERDILFDHPVLVQPKHFVTVLGNCLENAIEAAAKVENKEKTVLLEMRATRGSVFIRVTNPVKEDVKIVDDKLIETSKADKSKHGFGLKNMRDVVELYDGYISLKCENKMFRTTIRLNNWAEPLPNAKRLSNKSECSISY